MFFIVINRFEIRLIETIIIMTLGKCDKQRTVYLNDKTFHALREYLKVRKSESSYLFVSHQSEKMALSLINQIFNQNSDVITPKMLRHYFCSNALDSGEYKIHELANQAGHNNIQTTLIYSNPSAKRKKEKANKLCDKIRAHDCIKLKITINVKKQIGPILT